ncbi:hypothetical protein FQJ21_19595 [Escherichia coli]|nr:hypothetical protein [Escherichia coli]
MGDDHANFSPHQQEEAVRRYPAAYFLLLLFFHALTHAGRDDAPRDKCTLSCAINGIHAAFHYLKKNYISGCVMTVPTG